MAKIFSRKFILTLLFNAIVVGNAWAFGQALSWQHLMVLGAVNGVYFGSNVLQKSTEVYEDEVEAAFGFCKDEDDA